jgi:hypothetical protein
MIRVSSAVRAWRLNRARRQAASAKAAIDRGYARAVSGRQANLTRHSRRLRKANEAIRRLESGTTEPLDSVALATFADLAEPHPHKGNAALRYTCRQSG